MAKTKSNNLYLALVNPYRYVTFHYKSHGRYIYLIGEGSMRVSTGALWENNLYGIVKEEIKDLRKTLKMSFILSGAT